MATVRFCDRCQTKETNRIDVTPAFIGLHGTAPKLMADLCPDCHRDLDATLKGFLKGETVPHYPVLKA